MVGAYNLLTGGQFLTIKTFLFPLVGSEQDFIDLLYVNLPVQLSPWMGCLAIILICTAYVMKRCFFENTADSQTEILTAAIILVAIQMVYYVNRASQNCLYIVIPVMGILMGWIAEKTGKSKDRIYRVLFSWIATVLLMMAIVFLSISLVAIPPIVSIDNDNGVTSRSKISPAPASPANLPPWIEAPIATHSSGFKDLLGSLPVNCLTLS